MERVTEVTTTTTVMSQAHNTTMCFGKVLNGTVMTPFQQVNEGMKAQSQQQVCFISIS